MNERGDGAPRPAMRARARWFPSSRVGALRCDCKGSSRAHSYLGVRCRRAVGSPTCVTTHSTSPTTAPNGAEGSVKLTARTECTLTNVLPVVHAHQHSWTGATGAFLEPTCLSATSPHTKWCVCARSLARSLARGWAVRLAVTFASAPMESQT